jgi:hypothetical protein
MSTSDSSTPSPVQCVTRARAEDPKNARLKLALERRS